ncbi:MAG: GntR family transcriptional regulator [Chloroflexi bacterium]|nr:MAG: GntR family transcriptional regulator [Chloroflexota bacterium]
MTDSFLYHQIAEDIRQKILNQTLQPGDRLPSVRELAEAWHCTIGTARRAYQELARQGLVTSRPGRGTHVAHEPPVAQAAPLRRAALVHRAEAFLLEALASGHTLPEIEQAVRLAMDRWRVPPHRDTPRPEKTLAFAGSHDPLLAHIAARFHAIAPGWSLSLAFCGSRGGLIALAEGKADFAGAHLWDRETGQYNISFVRRFLPGRRTALVALAHRRLGLAVAPGNPHRLTGLADLPRAGLRFVNRAPGTGTRVWLDAQLAELGLSPAQIPGYETIAGSHSDVAQTIAEGRADAGLTVEYAAHAYSLTFIPLTTEQYDLVIPAENWSRPGLLALVQWLASSAARQELAALPGYDLSAAGQVRWVEG